MMWYSIEKQFKTLALKWIARHAPRRKPTPPGAVDPKRVRRILIVRQHDQFGDFLLTTPAIHALRTRFPDARLSLVVRAYLYPVAQGNPDVDEVLVFHESAFRWRAGDIRAFVDLMRQSADLAVVFNTVSHSLSSDLIAWLSGAPVVIGPASPMFDHLDHNPFYTVNAPVAPEPAHQIQRNLDLVRYVGADTDDLSYRYAMSEDERNGGRAIVESLTRHGDKPAGPVVAIHFGTGDAKKRYPVEQLARVCDELTSRLPARILVLTAPGEDERMRAFREAASARAYSAPPLSLREVAGVIHATDLLVCNDTGVLHLAAAVETSTLSFHAVSDPTYWKPPNPRHRAFYAASQRIDEIPPDRVCREIIAMLDNARGDVPGNIIRV